MKNRSFTADDYNLLKAQTRRLVTQCGGVESASQITRVNKTVLSDYQNGSNISCFAPIDVVADLERDAGTAFVTEALAKLSGHYLVPVPRTESALCLAQHLSSIGKETSEIFARAGSALAQAENTQQDHSGLVKEIDDAVRVLLQARGHLLNISGVGE